MGSLATLHETVRRPNAAPASQRDASWAVGRPEDLAGMICAAGQPVSIKRGQALFSAGEAADAVFVMLSGVMRTSTMLSDGRRQILGFHEAGELLGVTFAEQHLHSAEAVTATRLQTVSRIWLRALLDGQPQLSLCLIPLASQSIEAARRHLVLLGRMTARERLCTFLLERLNGESGIIELPMSRVDIADYLGLTIETVSRTITQLRFEGVIHAAAARTVEVTDHQRLLDCLDDSRQIGGAEAAQDKAAAAPARTSVRQAAVAG
jgi:CRP/FNR family transcriptional regulator